MHACRINRGMHVHTCMRACMHACTIYHIQYNNEFIYVHDQVCVHAWQPRRRLLRHRLLSPRLLSQGLLQDAWKGIESVWMMSSSLKSIKIMMRPRFQPYGLVGAWLGLTNAIEIVCDESHTMVDLFFWLSPSPYFDRSPKPCSFMFGIVLGGRISDHMFTIVLSYSAIIEIK